MKEVPPVSHHIRKLSLLYLTKHYLKTNTLSFHHYFST